MLLGWMSLVTLALLSMHRWIILRRMRFLAKLLPMLWRWETHLPQDDPVVRPQQNQGHQAHPSQRHQRISQSSAECDGLQDHQGNVGIARGGRFLVYFCELPPKGQFGAVLLWEAPLLLRSNTRPFGASEE